MVISIGRLIRLLCIHTHEKTQNKGAVGVIAEAPTLQAQEQQLIFAVGYSSLKPPGMTDAAYKRWATRRARFDDPANKTDQDGDRNIGETEE